MKKMEKIDVLIVGQGLAGSLLGFELLERGVKIRIVDSVGLDTGGGASATSSRVAAGVVNPVTGWRIVKTWRIDALLPVAQATYARVTQRLGLDALCNSRPIIRTIRNIEEENQWHLRASYPENAAYCERESFTQFLPNQVTPYRSFARILGGGQVDVPKMVNAFQDFFSKQNLLIQEKFDVEQIKILNEKQILYKNLETEKIVFCEGAAVVENPYFRDLPFQLDKGELLLVKIRGFELEKLGHIFKNKMTIVPLGDELYWVGATNEWHFADDQPSADRYDELVAALSNMLQMPFEIVAHRAAIRPTVKDRRPILGAHREFCNLLIFNGLGTKGTSLAPFFAKEMVDFLLDKKPIDAEVSIERFFK